MADGVLEILVSRINYWVYIALVMIGMYAMIAKRNLVKKIIGMNIMQTAVILFYVFPPGLQGWLFSPRPFPVSYRYTPGPVPA